MRWATRWRRAGAGPPQLQLDGFAAGAQRAPDGRADVEPGAASVPVTVNRTQPAGAAQRTREPQVAEELVGLVELVARTKREVLGPQDLVPAGPDHERRAGLVVVVRLGQLIGRLVLDGERDGIEHRDHRFGRGAARPELGENAVV